MLHVHKIASFDLPDLEPYRTMRRTQEQRDQGIFIAEGEKVVRRLLESSLPVISLCLPEHWLRAYEPLLHARPENEIHAFVANKDVLEQLTGFSMYQGVMAVAKVPPAPKLDDVLAQATKPLLFVAVDGLSNAENLGVIIRNAAAFGASGFIGSETTCSPWLRRSVRSSMGTIFRLPVIESAQLVQTLHELKRHGVHCVAAHPHTDEAVLSKAQLAGDCCIVLGSEGHGIRPEVLKLCDESVVVPMHPGVDSLNVAAASAVFLYEAARQRGKT
ncbi:MAG: RNA methyltransferase [Verrucomicrobiota bacterium]